MKTKNILLMNVMLITLLAGCATKPVALAPVGRAGVVAAPGHDGVSYRFWSADWTPWRALATVRTRWPALALHVKVLGITE